MITALWEGIGGWHWSLDTDDAVYSGLRATEAEARAEMGDVMRDLRAQDAAQVDALRTRAEAAEHRAEALAAELAQVRANAWVLVAEGLEIVESLSAGYDVWAEQARAEIDRLCAAGVDASAELPVCAKAAEQRAEAAEREVERLRSAIAETLRLADIYAGVAAHNAEAEPETAGEAWRSPYMATMRELRRALGGAA